MSIDDYDISDEITELANDMLDELDDDVVNSSLFIEEDDLTDKASEHLRNAFGLKVGIVTDVYEIDDNNNISKVTVEYDVEVHEQHGEDPTVQHIYRNCVTMDLFGGIADFLDIKYRKSDNKYSEGSISKEKGSIVTILCADGNTFDGIIVGGAKHPGRKTTLTKDAGHHLEGEFNGLNWKINDDGELTITYKSKTDAEGKPQDEDAGGTHIQIDKDGQVDVNTNLEGDDETYMRMDKKNKDVGLKAGQHIGLTAKKNVALIADADITLTAKAQLLAEAEGTAMVKSGGSMTVQAGGAFSLQAPNVQVQADGNVEVNGSQIGLFSPLVQVGQGGLPAVTLGTQVLATGNLGAPTIGIMIGPFSSSVFIAS